MLGHKVIGTVVAYTERQFTKVPHMDNSIYVTLSRQMAMFRDLEVTANNIANVNTAGFQAEKLIFDDYLVDGGKQERNLAFADDPMSYRDTRGGRVTQTGNSFDLAINGPGYFSVETPLGIRYTKAGNFQLNNEGQLVTLDGYKVLGDDGSAVSIPPESRNVSINGAGQISDNGNAIGQVGVFEFANEQRLERTGDTLFKTDDAPLAPATSRVMQGYIEQSNVNGVSEMVRLLQVQKSTGNTAKFIEVMYDLQRKTSETYTRPQA
jgi:flagellar basal-body rod protein FlgF